MAEICETVAETRRLTRVSAVGLVTFTRVSAAAATTEPDHFFTCFRQVSVDGNDISFTASINSFYYFPFLQSTGDTSVLVIEKIHIYLLLELVI